MDTHVWEIGKALGWVPPSAGRDDAYDHLNLKVPNHLKYDLHVLLVEHGKRCPACAKGGRVVGGGAAASSPDGGASSSAAPCPLAPLKLAARKRDPATAAQVIAAAAAAVPEDCPTPCKASVAAAGASLIKLEAGASSSEPRHPAVKAESRHPAVKAEPLLS